MEIILTLSFQNVRAAGLSRDRRYCLPVAVDAGSMRFLPLIFRMFHIKTILVLHGRTQGFDGVYLSMPRCGREKERRNREVAPSCHTDRAPGSVIAPASAGR